MEIMVSIFGMFISILSPAYNVLFLLQNRKSFTQRTQRGNRQRRIKASGVRREQCPKNFLTDKKSARTVFSDTAWKKS